jgi:hypothetical protein
MISGGRLALVVMLTLRMMTKEVVNGTKCFDEQVEDIKGWQLPTV